MTIQVDNALPPNVVEIGNEITQGVVDGLMSSSPSASSSNPYVTVNGVSGVYLPLAGGTMTGDIGVNYNDLNQVTSIVFSDSTVQTTASVGAGTWGSITGTLSSQTDLQNALNTKLTASSNLSDLANAGTARTNLGLGTMAVETASNYLTTATAASVYTTKANNLSDLASASTARTNLGLGSMAVATATDYLDKAGNLSGLANTATARTNLGVAYATDAEVRAGTSASTVLSPLNAQQLTDVNSYGGFQLSGFNWTGVTAGTGGNTYQTLSPNKEVQVSTAIGSSLLYVNLYCGSRGRLISQGIDWSKKNSFSIRIARNNTPATNTIFRCYLSQKSMATKTLDARGIGFIIDGAGNIVIHAHNGSALSTATTSFASVNTFNDVKIESDGAGTTTCFVNGVSVGTCTGSPTTNQGAGNSSYFNIELENTSVQSASQIYYTTFAKIDIE